MRRARILVGGLLVACAAALPATAAAATSPITDAFTTPCPTYGSDTICSGEVPSFDGTKLDVDLTLPAQGTGTTHPLIVLLHGFGNNKHEWESTTDAGDGADKSQWNSHWFARHGYYVLTYTARGFRDDGPDAPYEPSTPSGTSVDAPNGTIHVKSRDWEVRDTQWLAALVAAAYPDVDPHEVAVSGGSYGGGESWLQASQAHWDFPHSIDPALPVLDLQVAVPKYPWTDLAYALAPNGHGGGPALDDPYESSQGRPDSDAGAGNPIGVPKASYIGGLYELGTQQGVFEEGTSVPPGENGPEDITAWNTRLAVTGDPYELPDGTEDPLVAQARRGLTELRSAYYQDEGWRSEAATGDEVAIFSIQGWTDDLFEAVESFRGFKELKRLDPLWPVEVAVADVGHSRAQNKPATWQRLNDQAWQFLQANIGGAHRQTTTVASEPTLCPGDTDQASVGAADQVTASTPEGLANGALTVTYRGGDHTLVNPLGAPDPNGPATDPIFGDVTAPGEVCRTDRGPATGGYTGVSVPLSSATTYIGLGEVAVPYTLASTTATLDVRVWDVPPSGPSFLMTRGTYRIDVLGGYDPVTGVAHVPLWGNHWPLAKGHRVRLDLTLVDQPTLRPSNVPSVVTFGPPRLTLPTVEAAQKSLTGGP